MQAVDDNEVLAYRAHEIMDPARIGEGVWVIPLALPGVLVTMSLCYLIADEQGRGHLIDPGFDSDANRERILAGMAEAGVRPSELEHIIGTHLHSDHLGGAAALREATGAKVVLHSREQRGTAVVAAEYPRREMALREQLGRWGVPEAARPTALRAVHDHLPPAVVTADVLVEDGDVIEIAGDRLEVVHTPGHTWGHICIALPGRGLLFTGDHLLPTITSAVGIGGPAEPGEPTALDAYEASCRAIERFDGYEVAPGHGYRFTGLSSRSEEILERHRLRSTEVAVALAAEPEASVWDVASRISWARGFESLSGSHLVSALTQTEMHVAQIRRDQ